MDNAGTTPSTSAPTTASAATTAAATASAPVAVDVPDGAEQLDTELAPVGDDSQIAVGPAAAEWLDQAPPSVRQDVADNLDTTPDELTEQFLDDPTAFLSTDGMAGYIEPGLPDSAGDTTTARAATPSEASTAIGTIERNGSDGTTAPSTADVALASVPADVFALHSLPSSTKVIYLDFDGHLMQNEYWNSTYKIGPFDNQPYDIDGNPAAFSDTEQARIFEIWQRVADDYAPFDIDVTTQDPGIDGLRRSSTNDTTFGSRVVITSSDWFAAANDGKRIGGIALLNVFTSSTDHASYVFSGNLGSGNAKYVADATSHEAGHTLSLEHDGTSTAGYYSGHGSWGPIMGTPYSRSVTQWSHGRVPGRQQHRGGRPRRHRRTRRIPTRRPRRHRRRRDRRVGRQPERIHRRGRVGRRRRRLRVHPDRQRHTDLRDHAATRHQPPRPAHRARRSGRRRGRGGTVGRVGLVADHRGAGERRSVHRRGGADVVADVVHRVRHLRLARRLHHHLHRLPSPTTTSTDDDHHEYHDVHHHDVHHDVDDHHHDPAPTTTRLHDAPAPRTTYHEHLDEPTTTPHHEHHHIEQHDLDICTDHDHRDHHHEFRCLRRLPRRPRRRPTTTTTTTRHLRPHRHARTDWR